MNTEMILNAGKLLDASISNDLLEIDEETCRYVSIASINEHEPISKIWLINYRDDIFRILFYAGDNITKPYMNWNYRQALNHIRIKVMNDPSYHYTDDHFLPFRNKLAIIAHSEWLYNRQVFEFSDKLFKDLIESLDLTKKIPRDVIRYLSLKSFLIDLSNNDLSDFLMFSNKDGIYRSSTDQYDRLKMMYSSKGLFVSVYETHNEEDEVLIIFSIVNSYGIILYSNSLSIYYNETKEHSIQCIDFNFVYFVRYVVAAITYLSSDNPDMIESPDTKKTYNPRRKNKFRYGELSHSIKEIKKWDVGFRYANSIKENSNKSMSNYHSNRVGSPKRPHTRKGHWHHYWVGTGDNRHREKRWLEATYVNTEPTTELPAVIRKED